jgi:hypothetical protein
MPVRIFNRVSELTVFNDLQQRISLNNESRVWGPQNDVTTMCVTSWRNKGCFQLPCILHRGFWFQLWDWHVYSVSIQLQLLWQFELVTVKVSWHYYRTQSQYLATVKVSTVWVNFYVKEYWVLVLKAGWIAVLTHSVFYLSNCWVWVV